MSKLPTFARGCAAALSLSLAFVAAPASGGVLLLKNGDRITGEINHIWDGEIYIEPSYSDEFSVDIDAVAAVESERSFDIRLSERDKRVGRLVGVDDLGRQLLEIDERVIAVPLAGIVEVEEQADYFDWASHTDISVGVNKGNTNSETGRLRSDVTLKIGNHRHFGEVTFAREEQNGEAIKQQDLFTYTYNWIFQDPWFTGFSGTYERDPIRDLSGRLIAAGVVGRDVWNTPRRFLNFQAGLGLQAEEIGNTSNESTIAIWTARFRHEFFNSDLELFHDQTLVYNISGRDNTIIKTNTGARYDINDIFYANVSAGYDYESNPADLATSTDLALLFGVGAEF